MEGEDHGADLPGANAAADRRGEDHSDKDGHRHGDGKRVAEVPEGGRVTPRVAQAPQGREMAVQTDVEVLPLRIRKGGLPIERGAVPVEEPVEGNGGRASLQFHLEAGDAGVWLSGEQTEADEDVEKELDRVDDDEQHAPPRCHQGGSKRDEGRDDDEKVAGDVKQLVGGHTLHAVEESRTGCTARAGRARARAEFVAVHVLQQRVTTLARVLFVGITPHVAAELEIARQRPQDGCIHELLGVRRDPGALQESDRVECQGTDAVHGNGGDA
ncbi:hypothetical protein DFJ74DRAFT_684741 [Hyaloraphidium curvatum]|nr:hypothetical protein DFJ74DRAFT_684741 [Hyaloraphidium curvatum]